MCVYIVSKRTSSLLQKASSILKWQQTDLRKIALVDH